MCSTTVGCLVRGDMGNITRRIAIGLNDGRRNSQQSCAAQVDVVKIVACVFRLSTDNAPKHNTHTYRHALGNATL